jgi:CBS domain-containing protein
MTSALVRHIMRRDVPRVDGDAPIRAVARAMAAKGLSEVVVLVRSEPRGIVTERDMLREIVVHGRDAATTPISAIAGAPVCVLEDAPVERVGVLMRAAGVRVVLVIDALHRLHGLVALSDLPKSARADAWLLDTAADGGLGRLEGRHAQTRLR